MSHHESVLLNESIENLITLENGIYFEGTVGFAGHTQKILERLGSEAKLIGTDKDEFAFNFCREKFSDDRRVQLYNTSFLNIETISNLEMIEGYNGMFLDLGVSSYQLDSPESGFTYRQESIFDLRMNRSEGTPAYRYLNEMDEKDLADVIYKFGEEKKSRHIARAIVASRSSAEIKSSSQVNSIIERVIGKQHLNKSLSRVYQALRIFVNNELDDLEKFLKKSIELLLPGGRLVIISFHSLEDRIVKDFFKYESLSCICPPESPICICNKKQNLKILTKKPIIAGEVELKNNPRSRSAKLRVAEKI
ncbi:MAG: 16S rRNA (cytosine(1402)-N(4))-methyltransferase RsmH [Ignavibacteriae bacterium HGW-Ignavibacteriae-2]|jgi:16S rRNA (cytosine1402-N4)-methyltransferase|nr:MAG: 16S rRNA (cytosine(1402)-N(4))-methyltransferase RsmH [Ignavibacteriae bacterium HGW-Ignavibacteriae-2]